MDQKDFARRSTLAAATVVATLLLPMSAHAQGALAVGVDRRADGTWTMTAGYGTDYQAQEEAMQRALRECAMPGRGNPKARAACRIITTFQGRCFSLAVDTDNGAYGWSIRPDLELAKQVSVDDCAERLGQKERCKVSYFGCDR